LRFFYFFFIAARRRSTNDHSSKMDLNFECSSPPLYEATAPSRLDIVLSAPYCDMHKPFPEAKLKLMSNALKEFIISLRTLIPTDKFVQGMINEFIANDFDSFSDRQRHFLVTKLDQFKETKEMLENIELAALGARQRSFVMSLQEFFMKRQFLTPKQLAKLNSIADTMFE
jgi:hypothetical protein